MSHTPAYFDSMFHADSDPWKFRTRWYEVRKRALTLACLPKSHYDAAYEPGCANGELSAALSERCSRLLVSDGSAPAVQLARQRLAGLAHVEVRQAWVPTQWPDEQFDLIVISELAYFLTAGALDAMIGKIKASLSSGGTVLACHWRRRSDDCEFSGDRLHRQLGSGLGLPHLSRLIEPDVRVDVWSADPRSVAQQEGFA